MTSDRSSYPAASTARVTVSTVNAGTPFVGVARTTVEDAAGGEVARLDEREVSLEWGRAVSWDMDWAVGATRAGRYRFVVRLRPTGETEAAAVAERVFDVEPGLALLARVRPEPATVGEGAAVSFALLAQNQGANAPLAGATARLRVQLDGAVGPARFETVRALPTILPGGTWEAADLWLTAGPAGRYAVLFEIERGGSVLASAAALLTVVPAAAEIHGTLSVSPGDVLAGQPAEARVTVENRGAAGVSGHPLLVDVVSGAEATVHFSVPATVDLDPGQSRSLVLAIGTAAVPPGRHVVRLRAGASPVTLDRSSLVVHGLVAPPSPHAPANGARVPTAHPALVVNNASSPEGAALAYEFQLFGDEPLTQPLPGATGVAETPVAHRVAGAGAAGGRHRVLVASARDGRLLDERVERRLLVHRRRRQPAADGARSRHPGPRRARRVPPAPADRAQRRRPRAAAPHLRVPPGRGRRGDPGRRRAVGRSPKAWASPRGTRARPSTRTRSTTGPPAPGPQATSPRTSRPGASPCPSASTP